MNTYCYGLNCAPLKFIDVNPKLQDLKMWPYLKIAFKNVIKIINGVIRISPTSVYCYSYKERKFVHTETSWGMCLEEWPREEAERAKKGGLRGNQPWLHLHLRHPASRTVRKISLSCWSLAVCGVLLWLLGETNTHTFLSSTFTKC
jgi:hypothetical protein